MVLCPAVRVVRWATVPSWVARGDLVETVELVTDVAPGVVGGVLHHPDEQ